MADPTQTSFLPAPGGRLSSCCRRLAERRSRSGLGHSVIMILFPLLAASCNNIEGPYRDWRVYSGDPTGSKYSALEQINTDNVDQLEVAWTLRCGDMQERPPSTIECNPVIVDDLMYLTSPGLKLMAVDPETGKVTWSFDPFEGAPASGVNRGVTHWGGGADSRIFFVAGSYLYALDARTGERKTGFGDGGRVDLRNGLGHEDASLSVTATSPGTVYQDLLILGSVVGEGPGPAAPGHVRAFDVRSGEIRWIFHTIPRPGEPGYETWPPEAWRTVGGANAWGGLTLDQARGLVFFGTGSASYDHYGGNRTGQNLYANCIVALEAATGRRAWHYQVVHHDLWDYDLPCPPNLVTIQRDGKTVDAVAQPTKMGHLFVLDRETGQPLFPVEERPVPQSNLPGEVTWPTQPFPLKPPPYAQQMLTEAEVSDLSPASKSALLERLQKMRTGSLFLPPGLDPSVVLPQFNGGTDWGGAAFDPNSGVLYVNASNEAEWISMVEARLPDEMSRYDLGQRIFGPACSSCHGFATSVHPDSPALSTLRGGEAQSSRDRIIEVLEHGRGQMPAFSGLSGVEKAALAAYILDEGREERIVTKGLKLSFGEEIPYVATGHNVFRDPEGFPANKRPWGTLNAIDLSEGEILWRVPLGTYPALETRGLPPTGTFNMGGPLVTAGGLVFIGASMDERFHAYDKASGKLLWEFQLDAGAYATPATYSIRGRQFVVVAAGGGGKPETRPGDTYYCFALPAKSE